MQALLHGGWSTTEVHLRQDVLLRAIAEFRRLGGQSLTLSGGEPTLYEKYENWDRLAEAGFSKGLQLALMTNGTYLDRSRMNVIQGFNMNVGLGLDGVRAETHDANRGKGSFDETMRALDLLERYGHTPNVTICFTPLAINVYDLPGVVQFMMQRGLPRLYVSLLEERGRAEAFWEKLALTGSQKEWRDIVKCCGWARSGGVLLNHQTVLEFLSIQDMNNHF